MYHDTRCTVFKNRLSTNHYPHPPSQCGRHTSIAPKATLLPPTTADVICEPSSLGPDVRRLEVRLEVRPLEEALPAQLAAVAARLRATGVLVPLEL